MSKERELLKRVVEYMWVGDIVEEIKELLAQPEQEPEAWILEDKKTGYRRQSAYKPTDLDEEACNVIPLYTAPPVKSEQEPVAWKVVDGANGEFMFSRVKPMQRTYKYGAVIPLYSAPPKREPLGLEIMDVCGSEDYREGFKDGTLYAEKCHGITGVDDEH